MVVFLTEVKPRLVVACIHWPNTCNTGSIFLIRLITFSGPMLFTFSKMRREAPEAFYAELRKKDFVLTDQFKLGEALLELL